MFRFFTLLLTLVAIFIAPSSSLAMRSLKPGSVVDGFSMSAENGASMEVNFESRTKPVIVFFWASWCPRSADIMADLQDIFIQYGPEKIEVIGLNSDTEFPSKKELALAFELPAKLGITYTLAVDKQLDIYDAWGVGALPSAVLIDENGKVLNVLDGYPSTDLRSEFKEMIHSEISSASSAQQETKHAMASPKEHDASALTVLWNDEKKKDNKIQ